MPEHSVNSETESHGPDRISAFMYSCFVFGGLVAVAVMIATVLVSGLHLQDGERFALGTGRFGDSFGFTTSIFTGLAVFGLFISLRVQREELKALRREFKMSSDAQEGQKRVLGEQLQVARNQARSDLTINLLERWTSPEMRKQRLLAWNLYERLPKQSNGLKFSTLTLRSHDKAGFEALTNVCQFISDLKKLLEAERLDDSLVYSLFVGPVYPWFDFIEMIVVETIQKIDVHSPPGARVHGLEVQAWYSETAKFRHWFDSF